MKKITVATVKSFIRKNENQLFINEKSRFDGMTDSVESRNRGWGKLTKSTNHAFQVKDCPSLGYDGVWLVGSSRDYCKAYEDSSFIGYEVSNSCGKWIVALPKQKIAT